MSRQLNLDAIDVDGALAETAQEAAAGLGNGDTRLDFLKKAGLAGGAVMGGGAVLSALAPGMALAKGGRPPRSFGKGDIGILNYALTLEYLESAFYNEATANQASTKFIKNGQTNAALVRVTADERPPAFAVFDRPGQLPPRPGNRSDLRHRSPAADRSQLG
jgi:hypothetical protein